MSKYKSKNKLRSFCCAVAAISLFGLSACLDTSTPQDKAFEGAITQALQQNGDNIKVEEVHPGEWTQVCPIIEYDRVSRIAASALKLSTSEQVQITNTNDEVASSDQWGYIFLYPPDSVEYLRISSHFFTSGAEQGCVPKESAVFELVHKPNDSKRLRLIAK